MGESILGNRNSDRGVKHNRLEQRLVCHGPDELVYLYNYNGETNINNGDWVQ